MSHSAKHSFGPLKGSSHSGGHYPMISSHVSSFHHEGSHTLPHRSSHSSHQGPHYRTPSFHGGSGSKGISFSKHSSFGHGCDVGSGSHFSSSGGHGGCKKDGLFSINEKETMQLLNDRLSSYLEKVHSLEQENAQLERKICEWYANNATSSVPDYSHYFRTIEELQCQISAATMENARVALQIDNARQAADDFRSKYEMEAMMRNNVEADMCSLRRVLQELNMERSDLEIQVQCLQEELQQMKKNHEEEVNCLRGQLGAKINVEVNAAPSMDMNKALSEIREQYENMMERNMKEVENMFHARSEELNREVVSGAEQLESISSELVELKRCVKTLEIELQSQLCMKEALQGTLAETQAGYSSQLAELQGMINNVEEQLGQIRSDLERQNYEYRVLMDQKTHLEMEIATYKRLLDGHVINIPEHDFKGGKDGSQHQKC